MKDLNAFENEFNKLKITDYLIPTYSFVSIIELEIIFAGNPMKIHMRIHILNHVYSLNYQDQNISVSIQWINDVMKLITGICYL